MSIDIYHYLQNAIRNGHQSISWGWLWCGSLAKNTQTWFSCNQSNSIGSLCDCFILQSFRQAHSTFDILFLLADRSILTWAATGVVTEEDGESYNGECRPQETQSLCSSLGRGIPATWCRYNETRPRRKEPCCFPSAVGIFLWCRAGCLCHRVG